MRTFAFWLGIAFVALMFAWYAHFIWRQTRSQMTPRMATLARFNHPNLGKVICDNIRANLSLHGEGVAVVGNKKDALLVKWIIDNEYVPKKDIERAVHEGILQVGRSMFAWCCDDPLGNRPDHSLSTEALGYAMRHRAISIEEIATIRFDHGETPEEYIKSSEGLFEKVMLQLQNGTAFFDLSDLNIPGNFCHDCH